MAYRLYDVQDYDETNQVPPPAAAAAATFRYQTHEAPVNVTLANRRILSIPPTVNLPPGVNDTTVIDLRLVMRQAETDLSWVEFDAQITLQEMKDRLMLELGINVSKTTLHRELDKRVLTYKTVHYEPLQMNDPSFKDKRVEYVVAFRELMGQGKIPIWIDGTNFNLFTCRTKARSRRGTRAVVVRGGTQKGKNLHVIGAMSSANFFFCTHKRGAYKHQDANLWLRDMLRAATQHFGRLDDIVVIADNAPCHSRLEQVFEEAEFDSATLLRLSSYSPMFNPIENLWSEFKAHVKTHLRERLAAFMGPPPDGLTREEFRMQYLEHVAQEVIQGMLS
ncbi:hypothetical protein AaE_014878 [Aphanomyces astaci]|uniref:Tc1-like transposase DDE domain-containing protein n=1 Tax=Aphanomyces astaci TaxID=112090 RepID=A0A6A4Z5I1_APHAT|nr:hypothetical protein AaE_014878 [Aphanomyces astaci]